MHEVADQVARWLGIFSTGILVGEDAERSLLRAQAVLGDERMGELRAWFAGASKDAVADAKRAVIEAIIAVVHADHVIADDERELIGRIVQLAEVPPETARALVASLDAPVPLDQVAPRITQPALRELVLVMAWQMAQVDGDVAEAERGTYGELAKRLEIPPERAKALRALFAS